MEIIYNNTVEPKKKSYRKIKIELWSRLRLAITTDCKSIIPKRFTNVHDSSLLTVLFSKNSETRKFVNQKSSTEIFFKNTSSVSYDKGSTPKFMVRLRLHRKLQTKFNLPHTALKVLSKVSEEFSSSFFSLCHFVRRFKWCKIILIISRRLLSLEKRVHHVSVNFSLTLSACQLIQKLMTWQKRKKIDAEQPKASLPVLSSHGSTRKILR
jgi:hypothetical protein